MVLVAWLETIDREKKIFKGSSFSIKEAISFLTTWRIFNITKKLKERRLRRLGRQQGRKKMLRGNCRNFPKAFEGQAERSLLFLSL